MKKMLILFVITLILMLNMSCEIEVTGNDVVPSCEITYPENGAVIISSVLTVKVEASDPNGYIKEVVFYLGEDSIYTDNSKPYECNIDLSSLNSFGEYRVKAIAKDNKFGEEDDDILLFLLPPPSPYIRILTPNGGENWQKGGSHAITWDDNISGNVKIELYKGSSLNSTISSSTESDGYYMWNMATNLSSGSDYKIKITSINTSSINDWSNSTFTIPDADYITVTRPNGGENWQKGSSHVITWDDNISGNVKIELYKGSSLNSIISSSTESDGYYMWNMATNLSSGSDYKIKITSINTSSINDWSNSTFTIPDADYITVTSPNGGENWKKGSTHNITWNDNISGNVSIYLYSGSSVIKVITYGTASDGSYSWNLQNSLNTGSNYYIRVQSSGNDNFYDSSNNSFSITNSVAYIHHDNGVQDNSIGLDNGGEFTVASRFTSSELSSHYGKNLSALKLYIAEGGVQSVVLKVWKGGSSGNAGELVHSQDITPSIVYDELHQYDLTNQIPLNYGNEYWIGCTISHSSSYRPVGCDAGPAVSNKGDWVYIEEQWYLLHDLNSSLNVNWLLWMVVE